MKLSFVQPQWIDIKRLIKNPNILVVDFLGSLKINRLIMLEKTNGWVPNCISDPNILNDTSEPESRTLFPHNGIQEAINEITVNSKTLKCFSLTGIFLVTFSNGYTTHFSKLSSIDNIYISRFIFILQLIKKIIHFHSLKFYWLKFYCLEFSREFFSREFFS